MTEEQIVKEIAGLIQKCEANYTEQMKEYQEGIKQAETDYKERMEQMKVLLVMIKKYAEKKGQLTTDEMKEVQSITCYGSVGFCCGTKKPCLYRDSALLMLNMGKDFFDAEKTKWVFDVMGDRKPVEKLSKKEQAKLKKLDVETLKKAKAISVEEKSSTLSDLSEQSEQESEE